MSDKRDEHRAFVTRLLRRQRVWTYRPIQFSLRSSLVGVTLFCVLVWLSNLIVRTRPDEIPPAVHVWLLALWISLILGCVVPKSAQWYLATGVMGVCLASPILIVIYVHDLNDIPLVTIWSVLFAFGMFAHLGGGIARIAEDRTALGAAHLALFVLSVVAIIILFIR